MRTCVEAYTCRWPTSPTLHVLACPRQATYEIKAAAWDSDRFTAVFVAVFMGYSEYVYSLKFDSSECRIDGMTKIWNDGYAKAHMPPAAA